MTSEKKSDLWMGLWGFLAVAFILGAWYATYYKLNDLTAEDRGTFGDMFGSVNALFSGLALAGIIFTILLQRKELILQRKELSQTRDEFKTQNQTLRFQRFENTFFNLLSLHHQIVDSIDTDAYIEDRENETLLKQVPPKLKLVTVRGRDVFKMKYGELFDFIENSETELNFSYLKVYESVQTDFGHYFRNLYRIIKFVKETEFYSVAELNLNQNKDKPSYELANFEVRYKYTSMIRAQLSDYELLWIFYNCLSENGKEKFKPLVEEFSLLQNMPWNKLTNEDLTDKYDLKAFGKLTPNV